MKKFGTPLQEPSEETKERLDQLHLKGLRLITKNPNISVQEMREMIRPKRENTIDVIFLKHM